MKTKQTTIHRSGAKWLPGAMALAATAANSHAATVQITLTGNKVSSTGGYSLHADLTGDGVGDFVVGGSVGVVAVYADVSGYKFQAGDVGKTFFITSNVKSTGGNITRNVFSGTTPFSGVVRNTISFADARINGGTSTSAWLEVHTFNTSAGDNTIELTRLIFDDASATAPVLSSTPGVQTEWVPAAAIPEPSSFALLGLGAAGLLARRRRQAA